MASKQRSRSRRALGGGDPEDRKLHQLCAQAERALRYVLAEAGDETIAELEVIGVEPNPGASRLLVWVRPWSREVTAERDEILRALASEAGRLRTAVAESVHRKRAPDLAFELAPWLHGDDEGVGPRADGEGGEP